MRSENLNVELGRVQWKMTKVSEIRNYEEQMECI